MSKIRRTQQILEHIPLLLPKGRVLDAGTGKGELAHGLMAMGYDVAACDIDPAACRFPDIEVTKADIIAGLPYADGTFDLVAALEVIEHMESPFRAVREFHRILKPEGLLLLTTPNYGNIEKRLFYLCAGTLPRALRYEPAEPAAGRAHHHVAPMSLSLLKYMLETNGFDVIDIFTANPKRKIWLLAPLVGVIWLFLHVFWSRSRRREYHVSDQMRVILGGRSLALVARKRTQANAGGPRTAADGSVHLLEQERGGTCQR